MRCSGWPCDTPYAIYPEQYLHDDQTKRMTVEEVLTRTHQLYAATGASNICLTGGEPFVQPARDLKLLCEGLKGFTIEMFSNGSIVYPEWVCDLMLVMMDWKLEGSGEAHSFRDNRLANATYLYEDAGIKFVVCNTADLLEAKQWVTTLLRDYEVRTNFWVGAAWGHISDHDIVEFTKANRIEWRLNVQTHKHIWPPEQREI